MHNFLLVVNQESCSVKCALFILERELEKEIRCKYRVSIVFYMYILV
jgi:hypothetical protein